MNPFGVCRFPMRLAGASLLALMLATLAGCGGGSLAALQTVQVAPAKASTAAGTSLQFTATGIYSDGHSEDVTAMASWSTSNSSIASVSSGSSSLSMR